MYGRRGCVIAGDTSSETRPAHQTESDGVQDSSQRLLGGGAPSGWRRFPANAGEHPADDGLLQTKLHAHLR